MSFIAADGRAADFAPPTYATPDLEAAGVACTLNDPFTLAATAATLPWPSVWFGHFSGGRPYSDGTGRILIDWRNEHVCFADRSQCKAWIAEMRRSYSEPEGEWTCLFLR
jgi:hypothetical protein